MCTSWKMFTFKILTVLVSLVVLCSPRILLPKKLIQVNSYENSNSIGTPCSTNISNAYVDIYLIIDVSANMGAANLRQLGLSLSSELTTVPIAGLDDPHTSRVSIITYDETVNVLANFTQLNSHADVSNMLLSLKVSNSSSAAGIEDAFSAAETMMIDCWIDMNCGIYRQQAFVFIGASMNGVNTSSLIKTASEMNLRQSWITINWNNKDATLKQVFDKIATPSFNLSNTDKNVYEKFLWALTQTNCYCPGDPYQLFGYNTAKNRYERFVDCYMDSEFIGYGNTSVSNLCLLEDGFTSSAITSAVKHDFIRNRLINSFNESGENYFPDHYYNGLHRNNQGKWMWFDYDSSEFALGNFTAWYPGYTEKSPGNCVKAQLQPSSNNYLWMTTSCFSDNVTLVCQTLGCDADRTNCITSLKKKKYHFKI